MKKWEYLVIRVFSDVFSPDSITRDFGVYGKDGWELVSVDGGIAYFKRLAKSPIPVFSNGTAIDSEYKAVYDD